MPSITIQSPIDQPTGSFRFLDELRANLQNSDFSSFKFISAFSKVGPYLRLKPEFDSWKAQGKALSTILGIDQNGTSSQALQFVLDNFGQSYLASIGKGLYKPTFHPKIYIFHGASRGVAYFGSNNMTVGGTETNSESFIKLDMVLPSEDAMFAQVLKCWTDCLTFSLPLTQTLVNQLVVEGAVIDEAQMRKSVVRTSTMSSPTLSASIVNFPQVTVKPASPIPKNVIQPVSTHLATASIPVTSTILNSGIQSLVIQITPHHNGEILLSKLAVNQNPNFFDYPFAGSTVPKKASNPSYPQRLPDPIVNITVFDALANVLFSYPNFNLNTVYYTPKSEIRITVPTTIYAQVPSLSIMVMSKSVITGLDYDINIYIPGSTEYNQYLASCNYTMPSGGVASPRRFGWI